MAKLTFGDFINISAKSPKAKVTEMRYIKGREKYSIITDPYKKFRDGVIRGHKQNKTPLHLNTILNTIPEKKKPYYLALIEGYQKWWGDRNLQWHAPVHTIYSYGGVEIDVKPQLGFTMDGRHYLVRMYLKKDNLSIPSANLINSLMELALRPQLSPGAKISVLDIRNSKEFAAPPMNSFLEKLVHQEMEYIAEQWDKIELSDLEEK